LETKKEGAAHVIWTAQRKDRVKDRGGESGGLHPFRIDIPGTKGKKTWNCWLLLQICALKVLRVFRDGIKRLSGR